MTAKCFALPEDTVLLPTQRGALAISPSKGTFCAVHADECHAIHAALETASDVISEPLKTRLDKHGFFDPPRPFRQARKLLQFQVTNACNLHCAYCSADSGHPRPKELSFEDVKNVMAEAISLLPDIRFSFTGGEPLLVPWIFDAIQAAYAYSHKPVGLLSNLLILKNNSIKFQQVVHLLKQNQLQLQMSLSGASREVCDRLSGRPCFDDALAILRRLAEAGVKPNLDVMLSAPDAQANVAAFSDLRHALPPGIHISLGILYPCGREKGEHTFATADALEATLDDIAFEGGVSVPAPDPRPKVFRRKACQCIENENLYIQSDGTIFSCFKLVEPFGHISEGLGTVLERRRKQTLLAADLPLCCDCPFVSLCAGGCHADNIILEASVKAPICGQWRKQLFAEMLFEDKSYVFDWPVMHQLAEAKKRGISTPSFVITAFCANHHLLQGKGISEFP